MPKRYKSFGCHRRALLCALLSTLLLSACASVPPRNSVKVESLPARCESLLNSLEYQIQQHRVRDAQHSVVAGYPLLRINRLLAELANSALNQSQRAAWLQRAGELAIHDYLIEFINLPQAAKARLPSRGEIKAQLFDCAWQQQASLQQPAAWQALQPALRVESEYFGGRQLLGLYPITNLGMKAGIQQWQRQTRELFNQTANRNEIPVVVWQHSPPAERVNSPTPWRYDSLGWPLLSANEWQSLASHYAPSWVIEQGGEFDQPGIPLPGATFKPAEVVYWQGSVGQVHGQLLPQISYVIWFAERPKAGSFDLLGGSLDGVIFRITFNRAGRPLIYDSIHPCGCYHLFFPTPQLAHCAVDGDREPAFVPQAAPNKPFAVWLQSATHYVQGLKPSAASAARRGYQLLPLDRLRQAEPDGDRLYNGYGHVAGSERLERFLLWTSGLVSPGGMRQWGNHATAFSGERYFDEPGLFDREFCLNADNN